MTYRDLLHYLKNATSQELDGAVTVMRSDANDEVTPVYSLDSVTDEVSDRLYLMVQR